MLCELFLSFFGFFLFLFFFFVGFFSFFSFLLVFDVSLSSPSVFGLLSDDSVLSFCSANVGASSEFCASASGAASARYHWKITRNYEIVKLVHGKKLFQNKNLGEYLSCCSINIMTISKGGMMLKTEFGPARNDVIQHLWNWLPSRLHCQCEWQKKNHSIFSLYWFNSLDLVNSENNRMVPIEFCRSLYSWIQIWKQNGTKWGVGKCCRTIFPFWYKALKYQKYYIAQ